MFTSFCIVTDINLIRYDFGLTGDDGVVMLALVCDGLLDLKSFSSNFCYYFHTENAIV